MTENTPPPSRIVPCPQCSSLNRVPLSVASAQEAKCGKCKGTLDTKSAVFEVSTAALNKIVLNAPVPVVVDFWAPWCGPCVAFAPTYKHYAQNNSREALFLKLDTEAHQDAGSQFNIRGIPTLIFFQGEKEKARQSGAMPAPMLSQWIKGLL